MHANEQFATYIEWGLGTRDWGLGREKLRNKREKSKNEEVRLS